MICRMAAIVLEEEMARNKPAGASRPAPPPPPPARQKFVIALFDLEVSQISMLIIRILLLCCF
jgi:hypothetical protein